MNPMFYINVSHLMLNRPVLRDNILDRDRAESLTELQILPVKCRDSDYYE